MHAVYACMHTGLRQQYVLLLLLLLWHVVTTALAYAMEEEEEYWGKPWCLCDLMYIM